MPTDKRKQSLCFTTEMMAEVAQEAERLDRSLSWVVQRCVKIAMADIRALPSCSVNECEAAE